MNIAGNRIAVKYSRREMHLRLQWAFVLPFFRYSPRPFFSWRCSLLRRFGANIGKEVHIYNSATIYFPWHLTIEEWSSIGENALVYNLGPVTVGREVTVSHRAHLCGGTHDYTDPAMPLKKPPIVIKDRAWICTDAFVGPNVTVGEGAVVGARAVAVNDVPPWVVVAGNPARFVKSRELKP